MSEYALGLGSEIEPSQWLASQAGSQHPVPGEYLALEVGISESLSSRNRSRGKQDEKKPAGLGRGGLESILGRVEETSE